jgi:hypothetical protein
LFIFPRILLSVAVLMFLLSSTSSFPEDSPHIFTILKKVSFEEYNSKSTKSRIVYFTSGSSLI